MPNFIITKCDRLPKVFDKIFKFLVKLNISTNIYI